MQNKGYATNKIRQITNASSWTLKNLNMQPNEYLKYFLDVLTYI